MYNVDIDAASGRLTAKLTGLWTLGTVGDYANALQCAARSIAGREPKARWLIDLSESPVQPRDVAERLATVVAGIPESADAVIAIVSAKALMSMQVRRVPMDNARLFADREAAVAWLGAAAG